MGSTGMWAATYIHLTSHMPCHPGIIAFTRTILPNMTCTSLCLTHLTVQLKQFQHTNAPMKDGIKNTSSNIANSLCLSHDREIITSPVLTYGFLKDFVITIHRDHIAKCCGMQEERLSTEAFLTPLQRQINTC